jgi:hypothetical protein
MNKLREKILTSKDLKSVIETVPEFGNAKLELREMTAAQRGLFQRSVTIDEKGRAELPEYYVTAIALGVHDPATGEPVFTLDDRQALFEKGFRVIERLGKKLLALSAIGKNDEPEGAEGTDPEPPSV